MNAMIFAAGLGTRLSPLTDNRPKAMVSFCGKPLLEHTIESLKGIGVERIVVNVHHFADQIETFLKSRDWHCEIVLSDETGQLLETGGGLIKANPLFIPDKPILIKNVDILTPANLEKFIFSHQSNQNDATLMVKRRKTSRYLLFDKEGLLCGWRNKASGEQINVRLCEQEEEFGFCGLHLIEPELIREMGEERPFSIIKAYLSLAEQFNVRAFKMDEEEAWFDVGTIEKLEEAERYYKSLN